MAKKKQATRRKTKTSRKTKVTLRSNHPTKMAHREKDGVLDTRRINVQNRIRATMTGTRNLDEAVHKVNFWLKALMEDMHWDNRERALSAYRGVLHALRDILPYREAVHFAAQLPIIFKGIYYDGWVPRRIPRYEINTPADFYALVRDELGTAGHKFTNTTIRDFTLSIFQAFADHMGPGELRKIKGMLRRHTKELIPDRQRNYEATY